MIAFSIPRPIAVSISLKAAALTCVPSGTPVRAVFGLASVMTRFACCEKVSPCLLPCEGCAEVS